MTETQPECGHPEAPPGGCACLHLLADHDLDQWQRFTGQGTEFELLCPECAKNDGQRELSLRVVCAACFETVRRETYLDGIVGEPEIRDRATGLRFSHREVCPGLTDGEEVAVLAAVERTARPVFLAVTRAGEIVRIDLDAGTVVPIMTAPASEIDWTAPLSLVVSPGGEWAVLSNTRAQFGHVLDLKAGKSAWTLDRSDYCAEHCNLAAAFFELDGRLLLVHGTDWNRLDISDPHTGERLTPREPTSYERGEPKPDHYLDYFHCGLAVSPGGEWIADNGWAWHPAGIVRTWNLRRWMQENVWESEDGPSVRDLCVRTYFWDGPLCWIDETTVAIWGYGRDDDHLRPAALLYDVQAPEDWKRVPRWFPGPEGQFYFDRYLFSVSAERGTAVWDVETGERLLYDPEFRPDAYHRGTRRFVTRKEDGTFLVSSLEGEPG